jgi:hypothetical protein
MQAKAGSEILLPAFIFSSFKNAFQRSSSEIDSRNSFFHTNTACNLGIKTTCTSSNANTFETKCWSHISNNDSSMYGVVADWFALGTCEMLLLAGSRFSGAVWFLEILPELRFVVARIPKSMSLFVRCEKACLMAVPRNVRKS